MALVDEESTNTKRLAQEQEEQQFSDGTDGPSKSTAPAAIDLRNG